MYRLSESYYLKKECHIKGVIKDSAYPSQYSKLVRLDISGSHPQFAVGAYDRSNTRPVRENTLCMEHDKLTLWHTAYLTFGRNGSSTSFGITLSAFSSKTTNGGFVQCSLSGHVLTAVVTKKTFDARKGNLR